MAYSLLVIGAKFSKDGYSNNCLEKSDTIDNKEHLLESVNNHTYIDEDCKTWNTPLQADHNILVELSRTYNIKIICIDPAYPQSINTDNIDYIKDTLILNREDILTNADKFFDPTAHNIIIDFCNLIYLDKYHYELDNPDIFGTIKNDIKMTILTCGCGWYEGFPINTVKLIIENNIETGKNISEVHNNVKKYKNADLQLATEDIQLYLYSQYMFIGKLSNKNAELHSEEIKNIILDLWQNDLINPCENLLKWLFENERWMQQSNQEIKIITDIIFGL